MPVQNWQKAISLPVISHVCDRNWNSVSACNLLVDSVLDCGKYCLDKQGAINLILPGDMPSAICLALLRNSFSKEKIRAISVFRHDGINAQGYSKRLADRFSAEHISLEITADILKVIGAEYGEQYRVDQHDVLHREQIELFALIKTLAKASVTTAISCMGALELLGGYSDHKQYSGDMQLIAYETIWRALPSMLLEPTEAMAGYAGIQIMYPYLEPRFVNYISHIPPQARSTDTENLIPLKFLTNFYRLRQD